MAEPWRIPPFSYWPTFTGEEPPAFPLNQAWPAYRSALGAMQANQMGDPPAPKYVFAAPMRVGPRFVLIPLPFNQRGTWSGQWPLTRSTTPVPPIP